MKKEMLINVLQPEECRIAIVEDGVLEELYVERASHESYVGNIYKGRIVNIEPSIQAAFVDFGVGRNGFLHVSDVEPAYYRHLRDDREDGRGRRRGGRRPRPAMASRPATVVSAPEEPQEEPPPAPPADVPEQPDDVDEVDEFTSELEALAEQYSEQPIGEIFSPPSLLPPVFGEPSEISLVNETNAPSIAEKTGRDADATNSEKQVPSDVDIFFAEDDVDESSGEATSPETTDNREQTASAESAEEPQPMASVERRTSFEDQAQSAEASADLEANEPAAEIEDAAAVAETESERAEEEGEDQETSPERDFSDEDLSFSLHRTGAPVESDALPDTDIDTVVEQTEELPTPQERPQRRPPQRRSAPSGRSAYRQDDDYMPRRTGRGDRNRRGRNNHHPRGRSRGGRSMGRPKPLIQDIFKKGQEVLVQVIKEGIGTKGPTLSTYISIAGRYLVLMPGLNRIGVSRKINDEGQRRRLRDILSDLKPPKGLGFIIRTAGVDRSKKELQRDLAYLSRLWQVVVRRIRKQKSPAEIYQESDMIIRTIRDTFGSEIKTIWVDEPNAFEHAKEFLQVVMPRYANRINLYDSGEPMFHKYGIEDEIDRIHDKHVPLPNGGSIVIEQTEALVAIDVNSGNFRADDNAEETAYQMNLLAAKEIARQLRLRDMGGVIVNDFIDMRDERHQRAVERALRDAVKRDRARTKILRMSAFGIVEMTRQRIRPSLKRSLFHDCPHCGGSGLVKTAESMSIDVMRMVMLASARPDVVRIDIRVQDAVANYLLNRKRKELAQLEEETETRVRVEGAVAAPELLEFLCYDNNGNEIRFLPGDPPRSKRHDFRR